MTGFFKSLIFNRRSSHIFTIQNVLHFARRRISLEKHLGSFNNRFFRRVGSRLLAPLKSNQSNFIRSICLATSRSCQNKLVTSFFPTFQKRNSSEFVSKTLPRQFSKGGCQKKIPTTSKVLNKRTPPPPPFSIFVGSAKI